MTNVLESGSPDGVAAPTAALELWRVSKGFPAQQKAVVKDFDLKVAEGEFVSIIGHSGCGKSTVLSMIAGLTTATTGGILVDGREINGPGPDRGVVFQAPSLLPWLTARDNVMLGVDQVYGRLKRTERTAIVEKYLRLVGLGDAMEKRPAELSQGMRQRVGIARAFAIQPRVLLLDEPFGMLDALTRFELQEILMDVWRADRKTAILITHDVDEALYLSDRIVMMTSAPEAHVGEILEVPFGRPRDRAELMETAEYESCRDRILAFLEGAHLRPTTVVADQPADATEALPAGV